VRLAVISDIHGSLPSLEAVLDEIHRSAVDGILVPGDMTCGPNSVEALQRLQAEDCQMVLGNNEDYLLRFDRGDAPDWWHTAKQWAFTRWVYHHMDRPSLDLLHSLPEQRVVDLPGLAPIRMFHGTPRSINEHLYPGFKREPLEAAFAATTEAVLVCGHTHIPWQETRDGRLAFNPGAVCFTNNHDPGAQYALLTWEAGRWEVEHHSVLYDRARLRRDYEATGLLEEGGAFARACLLTAETGWNLAVELLEHAFGLAARLGHPDCEYVPDEIWDQAVETFRWERTPAWKSTSSAST
jgi:putative phosphoesterase